jgi:hypothetical protein
MLDLSLDLHLLCHALTPDATTSKSQGKFRSQNCAGNGIAGPGAQKVAEALQVNTTLEELQLAWNCIVEHGAKALADALCVNTTLTALDMSANGIGTCDNRRRATSRPIFPLDVTCDLLESNAINVQTGYAIQSSFFSWGLKPTKFHQMV